MNRLLGAFALVVGLSATPALATEWVNCGAEGGEASFDYLAGALPILSIVGLNVSVGEKVWASDVAYGPGEPIAVGQAFEDEEKVLIDVVDENVETVIAQLRLFKAVEGDSLVVYSGVLRIPGFGAWPVTCDGP